MVTSCVMHAGPAPRRIDVMHRKRAVFLIARTQSRNGNLALQVGAVFAMAMNASAGSAFQLEATIALA